MAHFFTPPTVADVPPAYVGPGAAEGKEDSHLADTSPGIQRLMTRYASTPRGVNVFLFADGTVSEVQPGTWDPNDPDAPSDSGYNPFTFVTTETVPPTSEQVVKVFWGSCRNPVTDAEKTILEAAGYTVETV